MKSAANLRNLALACLVLALPLGLSNQYHLHIVQNMAILFIVACGLNVLVGLTGQKSLGHAGFYAVGAYTSALFTANLGAPVWLGMAAALVTSAFFGLLLAGPALRVKGPYLSMVTIAFGIAIEKAATEWQDLTGGPQGIYGVPPLSLAGMHLGPRSYTVVILALALLGGVLAANLTRSRFGRAFVALKESEVASESLGVSVYANKVLAFVISAVYAGLAGALFAHQNQYINSEIFTFELSIFFLIVVLFGGSGSLAGPVIGAAALTLFQENLSFLYKYHLFLYGGLLLFSVVVLPEGVAGFLKRLFSRPPAAGVATEHRLSAPPRFVGREVSRGPAPGAQPILEARGVTKLFGGLTAVSGLDLDVTPGAVHGLIGPNGSGKSTFLNLLSGFYKATQGEIRLAGQRIDGLPVNRIARLGIGRTFQHIEIFKDMSVLDNVKVGFHARGGSQLPATLLQLPSSRARERDIADKAHEVLAFLGLESLAESPARNLSHGHQRLLGIGRALATAPRLLLLDEPAAGLVHHEINDLKDIIARLRDLGMAVLLVEHHMELVMDVCSAITVLNYGQKIAEGAPEAIQNNEQVIQAYLG